MRILICEEDEKYVEELAEKIKSFPCDEKIIIESYTETNGATRRIYEQPIDMAFLGPLIHGQSGFELGKILTYEHPECIVFYVCDDYSYINECFENHAFQMIVKVQFHLLESEFQRALKLYHKIHYQVTFRLEDGSNIQLLPSEIIYIETDAKTSVVVVGKERYFGTFENMKLVKHRLLGYSFFQMHQRFFVNMEHIWLIKSGELGMDNGDTIPTSAINRDIIDEALQTFVNK